MSSLKRTKRQILKKLVKQSLKKSYCRCEVKNMIEGKLYYPEYANTFALTYAIAYAEDNKIAGIPWTSELYDWGKIQKKEMGDECIPKDNEIVAFYGTDEEVKFENFRGNKQRIKLPEYHPRLIFMPYDYTVYEKNYKTKSINPQRIVTSEDIKDIPEIDDFTALFTERGVSAKLQSDTEPQAKTLKKILFDGKPQITDLTNKKYPIQLFYYGAPLTIFYLNLYPKFLPIRIDVALNNKLCVLSDDNTTKKEYSNRFNTYLFLRYGNNVNEEIIGNIIETVKESFFQVYSNALLDSQLLSNVYKKYKENVPRGLFYTMRSVEDFTKAITLHCEAAIGKIREEIGLSEARGKALEQKSKDMLQFFKEFTSESHRGLYEERTKCLRDIKELALGCKAFLVFHWKKENGKTDWNKVFDTKSKDKFKLEGTYLYLYKSIVTCLAWRYCLLHYNLYNTPQKQEKQNFCSTLTRPINVRINKKYAISELDVEWINKNDYIQYKLTEEKVIVALAERIVGNDNSDDKREEIKECISYVEYILDSFVEDSLRDRNIDYVRTAYKKFNKIINGRYDYDKTTFSLLGKFLSFKVYEY